jgi:hypothetical protein
MYEAIEEGNLLEEEWTEVRSKSMQVIEEQEERITVASRAAI